MEGEEVERLREEARLLPRSDAAWPAENELEVVLPDSPKPAPFWAWILLVFSVSDQCGWVVEQMERVFGDKRPHVPVADHWNYGKFKPTAPQPANP